MADGKIKLGVETDFDKATRDIEGFSKRSQITLTALNQTLQDLPFGFIGIQNNLPMLISSFGKLTKEEKGVTNAFKALGETLFSPTGVVFATSALIATTTALVQKYGSLSAALTDIFGITQSYTSLLNVYNQSIVESTSKGEAEAISLKNLASILTDSNKTLDQRTGAYQAINKEYPGLLDNISKENALTEEGKRLIGERLDLYKKQILLQGQQESLVKLIAKAYENENQALADAVSGDYYTILGMQLKGWLQGDLNSATQALTYLNQTFKSSGKQIDFYSGILKDVQIELSGVNAKTKALADGEKNRGKELKQSLKNEKESAKLKKEQADALDKYNKALEKNRQLGVQFNIQAEDLAIKKANERQKAEEDLFNQLVKTSMANDKYGNSSYKQGIKALEAITKPIEETRKKLETARQLFTDVFFDPLSEAFSSFLETGKFSLKEFGDSVIKTINKIVTKILVTGVLKILSNLLFPGSGQAASAFGGQSFGDFFSGIISSVVGGKVAAPSFAGIGGGSMGMSGQVNLVLRGNDLVGASIVQILKFQELGEKYRIEFKSREGQDCVVRFDFASFSGTSTTILGGDRPFILREFNSDENVFKAVRPQQAEINIITGVGIVSIDDFIADTDQEITVYFDFGTWTNYWIGYVLQDDFQEIWQDTYHIITLRASDYIGQLKNVPLSDAGSELIGRYTPWSILSYALDNTPQSLVRARVINNLFHSSMTSGFGYMPLDQCYIDAKTFQQAVDTYDDSYTVIEKINNAFNQTLFMYDGYWRFVRIEELYRPFTDNLNEVYFPLTGAVGSNLRYDANIGVDESIKPVSPDMIRYPIRRTKSDTISFNYEPFEEIITNESFARGTLVSQTSTEDTYTLDYWSHNSGSPYSYVPLVSGSGRKVTYDTEGQLLENFAYLNDNTLNLQHFIISLPIKVKQGEIISISFDKRYSNGFSTNYIFGSAYVRLENTSNYWLQDDGTWSLTTATEIGQIEYNGTTGVSPIEYQTIQIDSQPFPIDGDLTIYLLGSNSNIPSGITTSSEIVRFKNLKINIQPTFGNYINYRVSGNKSIYTKSANITNNYQNELFLDDFSSEFYKGTIFQSDATTLTNKEWSRDRYPTEQLGFRQQNATSVWEHNLFTRNKIDANFYGLTWQRSGATYPIGLINTFKFVDDDPKKVYWILNLKEIDFSNSTWSATLVEMFDEDKDGPGGYELQTLTATNITGYVLLVGETKLKYTLTSAADFSINAGNDEITFDGTTPINTPIYCTFNLDILNINPSFPNAVFKLKLNGTDIATDTIDCSAGTPLTTSVNLNTISPITISYGDVLTVTMSSNIGDVDVNSGSLTLSYYSIIPPSYDTYEDKFIYQ